jgi:hypothetical protein
MFIQRVIIGICLCNTLLDNCTVYLFILYNLLQSFMWLKLLTVAGFSCFS